MSHRTHTTHHSTSTSFRLLADKIPTLNVTECHAIEERINHLSLTVSRPPNLTISHTSKSDDNDNNCQ